MAIRIEKAVSDCLGFGHDGDGRAVFVEDALPGELVECTEKERRNGFSIMECAEVLEPSPLRRAPYCPFYGRCGGCSFQIVDEKDSAAIKESVVKDNLRRIAKLEELPPFDPPAYGQAAGYRRRARFHVDFRGRRAGFLSPSSSELVELPACPLLSPRLSALLAVGKTLYEEGRRAMFSNMVNSRTGLAEVPAFDGDDEVTFSDKAVPVTVAGIRYYVSADVFFQSNPSLLPDLLAFVRDNAIGDSIMDLYSGVGTFSALFEGSGRRVWAVERDRRCLMLSRKNAPSALSFTSDVASWSRRSGRKVDTVIVDPPRTGLGQESASLIASFGAARIIYVSCNSVTLARDLPLLAGYSPVKARVFDFYPGSGHEESAVVLDRA